MSKLDPELLKLLRTVAHACQEYGWDIIVPGSDDSDVSVLVIGHPATIRQFDEYYFHGNEEDEIESQILSFGGSDE